MIQQFAGLGARRRQRREIVIAETGVRRKAQRTVGEPLIGLLLGRNALRQFDRRLVARSDARDIRRGNLFQFAVDGRDAILVLRQLQFEARNRRAALAGQGAFVVALHFANGALELAQSLALVRQQRNGQRANFGRQLIP